MCDVAFCQVTLTHVTDLLLDVVLMQTSPADGKVLYCGEVEHGMLEQVKGVSYSLVGFLGPFESLFPHHAEENLISVYDFTDYHCLLSNPLNKLYHCIIYLAPGDYHRFHSPADWTVFLRRYFPGELLDLVTRIVIDLINVAGNAIASVCLSVSFRSVFGTDLPLTLNFCV